MLRLRWRRPRALWLAPAEAEPEVEWSSGAERQLRRLPPIVRDVVGRSVERYARAHHLLCVTPSAVRAARVAARF